ncbi:MAG: Hsp70 family protein [Pseudomonadota bacterium]
MPERDGLIVGIDLGTTFSLVSVLPPGSREARPLVLENALGERLTPSVVALADDGGLLVGAPALAMATTHPDRVVRSFKREMGTDKVYTLGPHRLSPQELSAMVLRALKADAEALLGAPVVEAVVTVPAYFGGSQRAATRQAAELAGLVTERIINEPTAAAMAYGLHNLDKEQRAVVLDLGGGTFDVTVLEILEGVVEVQSSAGDARLGGEDFTETLARLAAARIAADHGHDPQQQPLGWARLLGAAEQAKRRLTEREEARLVLPRLGLAPGVERDVELTVTRDQAEACWQPLLARVREPIWRAFRDGGLDPRAMDEVLLVGGATRMPCFIREVASLCQRMPARHLPPDEAVAMGAAVQAALKRGQRAVEDLVVTDVAPFSLGIEVMQELGGHRLDGFFSPILERGTVIPASREQTFSTSEDGQTGIHIQVFEGEHSLTKDNRLLGEFHLRDLDRAPRGQPVRVRFTYDLNGLLEVEMTVPHQQRTETLLIERSPGQLSPEQIARARAAMARLKFHPREALPNTTALQRAEALYQELRGGPREEVGRTMSAFRLALETQDEAFIENQRALLLHVLDRFRDADASYDEPDGAP